MLEQLLKITDQVKHISLTGMINGMFYQTVFIPVGSDYTPFLLCEGGDYHEIKHAKEDKQSYVEILEKRYIFDIGEKLWFNSNLVNGVSREAVRLVLEQTRIDPNVLYQDVSRTVSGYYDFYSEEEKDVVVAHIIHSYLLGLLGKTFYLLLDGEKGTGKSNLQNVMALLQMNGCFCGKSSVASIVRKINSLGASTNHDELDKLDPKDTQILIGVMNSGLYRSGTYEITDMNEKKSQGQIKVYRTFSTKTFSTNKALFHDSFLSRCITIHTIRNNRKVKDIYTRTEEEESYFQALRDKLFAYCLINGKKIVESIKGRQAELELRGSYGRRTDIFAIVCGVLEVFKGEYKQTLEYLTEKDEMTVEDSEDRDRLYIVLSYFCEKIERGAESIVVTNQEITEYVREALALPDGDRFAPTASSMGTLLRRSKIVSSKKEKKRDSTGWKGGKGRYYYEILATKIKDVVMRSEYADLTQRIKALDAVQTSFTPSPDGRGLTRASVSEVFGEGIIEEGKSFTPSPEAINDS